MVLALAECAFRAQRHRLISCPRVWQTALAEAALAGCRPDIALDIARRRLEVGEAPGRSRRRRRALAAGMCPTSLMPSHLHALRRLAGTSLPLPRSNLGSRRLCATVDSSSISDRIHPNLRSQSPQYSRKDDPNLGPQAN
jgi:hypothetical protein